MTIKSLHRYLSLIVAAIWLVQAATGLLSVFRWEIDDATVAGVPVQVDMRAVGARIDALDAAPDTSVSSVWTSGSAANRFDIHYEVGELGHVMRVDGQGTPIRVRTSDYAAARGAIWDSITSIHTSLWAGDFGKWLIGISGILLFTNILLGLKLAWPRRGTWRKAMMGKPAGAPAARLHGWHRMVGLWLGIPALVTVSAGVGLVFVDAIESGLGAQLEEPAVAASVPAGDGIGAGAALQTALDHYPGSSFSGLYLPDEDAPWYRVRVRVPGELPRKWGSSNVFVDASTGRTLSAYDASEPRAERAVVDTLYPLHTGQAGGLIGRAIAFAIGCWLLAMIVLGVSLWWTRRKLLRRGSAKRAAPQPGHSQASGPSPG